MLLIETDRLQLRQFLPEDAQSLYALNANPEVLRYTGDKSFASEADALAFIESYDGYAIPGMGRLACVLKETSLMIGWCGLRKENGKEEVDIGFRFLQEEWGKGYATEAAAACLRYGFEKLKLPEIIGRAHVANVASMKVLHKIGMKEVGLFDFDLHPGMLFRLNQFEFGLGRANNKE